MAAIGLLVCLGAGCSSADAECDRDADCSADEVCVRSGGVVFGGTRCAPRRLADPSYDIGDADFGAPDAGDGGASGLCSNLDGLGTTCTVGQGICKRTGVRRCDPELGRLACSASPGEPGEETCNGRDDDCDGAVDEDLSESCSR